MRGKLIIIFVLLVSVVLASKQAFVRFKVQMQNKIKQLASAIQTKFKERCGEEITSCTVKSYDFCQGTSQKKCNPDFPLSQGCTVGTTVSTTSAIRFPPTTEINSMEDEERQLVCLTAQLEHDFQRFDVDRDKKYTLAYFGDSFGSFRQYPAWREQEQEIDGFCLKYDPRERPWYVAATTGPKNIIILIDASGTMEFSINDIREASQKIVNITAHVDYIGVIAMKNQTVYPLGFNQLKRAVQEVRNETVKEIKKLTTSGNSNYEAGFEMGLKMLNDAYDSQMDAPCNNAENIFLFLSDGLPRSGPQSAEDLIKSINEKREEREITIFTYAIGSETNDVFLRELACAFQGMMFKITDARKLTDITKSYYQYLSIGSYRTTPIWSERYTDHFGFGFLFTVSIPIYYSGDGFQRIIGVAGLDILANKMLSFGLNETQVESELISSLKKCPSLNFSECYMEFLRGDAKCNITSCNKSYNIPSCSNANQSSDIFLAPVNNDRNRCCSEEPPQPNPPITYIIPLAILCGIIGLAIIISIVSIIYMKRTQSGCFQRQKDSTIQIDTSPQTQTKLVKYNDSPVDLPRWELSKQSSVNHSST